MRSRLLLRDLLQLFEELSPRGHGLARSSRRRVRRWRDRLWCRCHGIEVDALDSFVRGHRLGDAGLLLASEEILQRPITLLLRDSYLGHGTNISASGPSRADTARSLRASSLVGMLETVRPVLRAAALSMLIVGGLLFALNPPSLSGAEDLLTIAVVALALVLGTAWVTATMIEHDDSLSEPEFERLVRRSEALADRTAVAREPSDFDMLVVDAIDRLPEQIQQLLENTPVVVSRRGAEAGAYGHYFGDTAARSNYEQRIVLYQDTLERDFGHDPELLTAQVERTLRHELAHHIGWSERGVRGLGL